MLEGSRIYRSLTTAGRRLSVLVRNSYLYRWLTAEPEPEVIVIDLRETWTVGPIIAILDRVFDALERAATGSMLVAMAAVAVDQTLEAPVRMAGLATLAVAALAAASAVPAGRTTGLLVAVGLLAVGTLALFETRSWAELRETRPVEFLVAILEPPEPPEREADHERPRSENEQAADDGEATEADADEPEGDALDDAHQGDDREVADNGARREGDDGSER
jgi:hypothetical protein